MARTSRSQVFAVLAAVAVLAGCAGLRPNVKKSDRYDPAMGYVVGTFGSIENSGFGLVLSDQVGRPFRLTFGEAKFGDATRELTGMVALPPGDYCLTHWITYARVSGLAELTHPIPKGHPFFRTFELKPGHVVYLGRFDAVMERETRGLIAMTVKTRWSLAAEHITADVVPPVIAREYAGFSAAPLECLLCEPPAPGAAAAAAAALPPSAAYGKKEVVLHYHRRDGDYQGWGLLAWESYQGPSNLSARAGTSEPERRLSGVTWEAPLPPTGFDDFGAYWALDERNFVNGRVNYVIHKGNTREQDGRDMFWLLRDSREAWVNADDTRVYLDRGSAEAGWKR